jgi:outer membrane receptor protein involved in Fe transport
MRLTRVFLVSVFTALAVPCAFAQSTTTSAIDGRVSDAAGRPVVGATVTVTHEPSGSKYTVVTREGGRYNLTGLRPGGPYIVQVNAPDTQPAEQRAETLELSLTRTIDFQLSPSEVIALERFVVEEGNDVQFGGDRTGAFTNVGREQIDVMPTLTRSLADFTRLTPQAVGNNIAGASSRYNNIQLDGVAINDVFGLNDNGQQTPTGNPISLDAIDQFQVQIAPFDVRQSGFAGGNINAVTRSGTNRFRGSFYYFFQNESLVGENAAGAKFSNFKDETRGFRLGGPIIKDKLFFFISAEQRRRSAPSTIGFTDQPGGASIIYPITRVQMDDIIKIAGAGGTLSTGQTVTGYGYDVGGVTEVTNVNNDDKVFARLDWNINANHRLTLRHNWVDGLDSRGTLPAAPRSTGDRTTTSLAVGSRQYDFTTTTNSTVAELNSTWSSFWASQVRVGYQTVRNQRVPKNIFPSVEIQTGGGSSVFLGVERSSQANALDQDILQFSTNIDYFYNAHTISFGVSAEDFEFSNLFVQNFFGDYRFSSIDAFRLGRPNRYRFNYSNFADDPQRRAEFGYYNVGLYAQDQWAVNDALTLTAGLRLDTAVFPDDPAYNATFASDFPGYNVSDVPSGNWVMSPRVGFNYNVGGKNDTQIRGGTGIFLSRAPSVWISNQYANTGLDFTTIETTSSTVLTNGFFVPDPNAQPRAGQRGLSASPSRTIALTDPEFKFPTVWKTSLAVDQKLPWWGLVATAELLYSDTLDDIFYQNIARVRSSTAPIEGVGPRPMYQQVSVPSGTNYASVLLLRNTSEGSTTNVTFQVERPARKGFFGKVAYTWGEARDVNSGTSSVAFSNWQNNRTLDPNANIVGRSNWEVKHRFLVAASYRFALKKNWDSTLTLIYEGRSGYPFSWTYNGDANNDGSFVNDLVYIPTSRPSNMSESDWNAFNAFVEATPDLRSRRGQYVDRNGSRMPWVNSLDFRYAQNIPVPYKGRLEFTLDVSNLFDLFGSDWGRVEYVDFNNYQLLRINGSNLTFQTPGTGNTAPVALVDDILSRWRVEVGLRYSF